MPWRSASVRTNLSAPEVETASLLEKHWRGLSSIYMNYLWCSKKDDITCISMMSEHILTFPKKVNRLTHHKSTHTTLHIRRQGPQGPQIISRTRIHRLEWMSCLRRRNSQTQLGAEIYFSSCSFGERHSMLAEQLAVHLSFSIIFAFLHLNLLANLQSNNTFLIHGWVSHDCLFEIMKTLTNLRVHVKKSHITRKTRVQNDANFNCAITGK